MTLPAAGWFLMAAFSKEYNDIQINQTMQENIELFELAINKAKDRNKFTETREKFVEVLGQEDATLNEGKWKPFFTVDEMNLEPVLIGMTHWNSMEGFGEAAMRLMPQEVAVNYFASFDPLAYGLLAAKDGKSFEMNSIKEEGNVVEFAIRKGKTLDAFGEKRDTFFQSLERYDGFKFAREFGYYELDTQGMPVLAENTQAVIIVWENAEKFQAAANPIFASTEYADFSALIDVKSYFAAFRWNNGHLLKSGLSTHSNRFCFSFSN
ncbi:hypothetical protein [Jiulongibacter sediminis]|jgi:hypothetical protein|uniref:hypothetical protein n=1 Tax=Jiulongibacter sediminis TaxID=1605367 RepID=UPI0026F2429F|nr:hypothetical protein [Jiulongibacter sediminis]